ncbi:MAG: universal stress protein [Rhizomicrobium sp.]|jgi:nucleotide-binding universal stress UspA family protein
MKTLLVPVLGSEGDRVALESALLVAEKFRSHLDCLHVRFSPRDLMLQTATVGAGMPVISPQLWTTLEDEEKERSKRATDVFETFRAAKTVKASDVPEAAETISATLREIEGNTVDEIVRGGQLCELIVMARRPEFAISPGQIGDILMRSGRPLLLGPTTVPATLGSTVAIAWKATAEAARALTAAMPLLRKAEKVIVLSADENDRGAEMAESADQLVRALKWSGIESRLSRLSRSHDPQSQLLMAASDTGADLLVMGAYSHSRARELLLGGLTSHVLQDAGVPVFLCH